jgi:hypothetical protein
MTFLDRHTHEGPPQWSNRITNKKEKAAASAAKRKAKAAAMKSMKAPSKALKAAAKKTAKMGTAAKKTAKALKPLKHAQMEDGDGDDDDAPDDDSSDDDSPDDGPQPKKKMVFYPAGLCKDTGCKHRVKPGCSKCRENEHGCLKCCTAKKAFRKANG